MGKQSSLAFLLTVAPTVTFVLAIASWSGAMWLKVINWVVYFAVVAGIETVVWITIGVADSARRNDVNAEPLLPNVSHGLLFLLPWHWILFGTAYICYKELAPGTDFPVAVLGEAGDVTSITPDQLRHSLHFFGLLLLALLEMPLHIIHMGTHYAIFFVLPISDYTPSRPLATTGGTQSLVHVFH